MKYIEADFHNNNHYVVSDIHGCGITFTALLEKINLQKSDSLYILGDMINRGKHSKKVIKTILNLKNSGYKVFCIRGNHEQFLIAEMNFNNRLQFKQISERLHLEWLLKKANPLEIKEKYFNFFNSLPFYIVCGNYILSHAGFDFSTPKYLENFYAMLQIRNATDFTFITDNKIFIHGHTPIRLSEIENSIINKKQIINIDNGCVYNDIDLQKGNLFCLNLKNMEYIIQKNIE